MSVFVWQVNLTKVIIITLASLIILYIYFMAIYFYGKMMYYISIDTNKYLVCVIVVASTNSCAVICIFCVARNEFSAKSLANVALRAQALHLNFTAQQHFNISLSWTPPAFLYNECSFSVDLPAKGDHMREWIR